MKAGTTLGQYRITGAIGLGGMGAVYSAQHTLIGRAAAVKILRPEFSDNAEVVQRFFNEARAAAAIRHPGIVEVLDFGWNGDGAAYLVMEQLQGESLSARLARGRLSLATAVMIARQMAGALAAAHRAGIVHRDLKPDNVFLVPDPELASGERIKLLDFGIAKLVADHDQHRMTRPGMVLGTPTYMSPEQCCGSSVDHRADLYALGCILFELCTGSPPFESASLLDLFEAHLHQPAPTVSSRIRDVPPAIDQLVRDLLSKDPAQRLASADAVVRAIDAANGGVLSSGPVPVFGLASGPRLLPKPSTLSGAVIETPAPAAPPRRWRWLGVPAIAVAAAGLGAIATGMLLRRADPAPTQHASAVAPAPTLVAVPVAVVPAPVVVAPAPVAPAPVAVAPAHRIHKPIDKHIDTPPVSVAPAPAPAPGVDNAQQLADLYVRVGRAISALDQRFGRTATEDLWPEYRRIRLQDAILDQSLRSEAAQVLQRLDAIAASRAP